MDLTTLHAELTSDTRYASLDHAAAAAALNAADIAVLTPCLITKRTIYRELGIARGVAVLQELRSRAVADPVIREVVSLLDDLAGGGVDVAHAAARSMVDLFVTEGVLTADEGATIKGLASHQVTRASQLGLGEVTPGDVERARAGG